MKMKERRKQRPGMTHERCGGVRLQTLSSVMIIAAVIVTAGLLFGVNRLMDTYHSLKDTTDAYISCQDDARNMMEASDYLTNEARAFSVTGDRIHLDNYFTESTQTQRRDTALRHLEGYMPESDAVQFLKGALEESIELMDREYYSMRLVIDAQGYDIKEFPEAVQKVKLKAEDKSLSADEKMILATDIMFDDVYQNEKEKISAHVEQCLNQILNTVEASQTENYSLMESLMTRVSILIGIILLLFLLLVAMIIGLIVQPIKEYVTFINEKRYLPMRGAFELRFLASAYNRMYEENQAHSDQLAYEAVHDSLTGAYNRAGFEERYHASDKNSIVLLLIDIDRFKEINDTHGHSVGDQVLKRVVNLIRDNFRAEDYVCRIGGDEFAVIMLFADSSMKPQIEEKISIINHELRNPPGTLPQVSLSVGVAAGDRKNPTPDMFKDADAALYAVKRAGRNGCAFYGESEDTKAGPAEQN